MGTTSTLRQALRERIARSPILVVPGTGDALGARLIEQAGFEAVYMSGFCVEGSHGLPDVGFLGMSEMAGRAAQLVDATGLPVICDADTGYGGIPNVMRTVRAFERAGVAAIQIEDQALPKKCGTMAGKRVVPTAEMVGRLSAAVDARVDASMIVIGRSDAVAIEGLQAGIDRLHAYAEAGADLLMLLGPYSADDVARFVPALPRPFVYLNSESLGMPMLAAPELERLGVSSVVFPLSLLLAATRAMRGVLDEIRTRGTTLHCMDTTMVPWKTFNELVGLPAVQDADRRFAPPG